MGYITNSLSRFDFLSRLRANWGGSAKHDHYKDFGWPETLTFDNFLRMYKRNSLAASLVDKTVAKTWETFPTLWETEKAQASDLEKEVAKHFAKIRAWRALMTTDRRSLVGKYAGALLLLADNRPLHEEVGPITGGLKGLVGITPLWESQISPGELVNDPTSPDYGKPRYYNVQEQSVDGTKTLRSVRVHPDRLLIWSEDGTMDGDSILEPCFNDLIDAEKIKGAGGEGFWKNSRGAPIIEAPDGVTPAQVAKAMGVQTPEMLDKINQQLDDFNQGFDKGLLLGGMTAKPLSVSLPQPEQFFSIPERLVATSGKIPVRILIGNQTGERASTEDAREWAKTNMGRRANLVLPCLQELIDRLVAFAVLPDRPWTVGWDDLTEATAGEKLERADKMSNINSRVEPGDELVFSTDEIREAAGFKSLADVEEDGDPEDQDPSPPKAKEPEDDPLPDPPTETS